MGNSTQTECDGIDQNLFHRQYQFTYCETDRLDIGSDIWFYLTQGKPPAETCNRAH